MRNSRILVLAVVCFSIITLSLQADDWPFWRGPNKNGISTEKGWDPQKISNVAWEKNVGLGYSAIVVKGDKVYTMGNKDKKNDTVYCLDAKTGKEIWTYSYKCSAGGGYAGPRSTPVVVNGMIYTFSKAGQVHCLDAKTGKKKWENNVNKLGAKNISWQYSGAINVANGLAIINAGEKGIALDTKTGRKKMGVFRAGGICCTCYFQKR